MNRIIIIGNGFDLAHGLETSYGHFLKWLQERILITHDEQNFFKKVNLPEGYSTLGKESSVKEFLEHYETERLTFDFESFINSHSDNGCKFEYENNFLEHIIKTQHLENWVDIEEEYFKELYKCLKLYKETNKISDLEKLHRDFDSIKCTLMVYLTNKILRRGEDIKRLEICADEKMTKKDFVGFSDEKIELDKILFLNFNYTSLEKLYLKESFEQIHIHGSIIDDPKSIIFGYGNENTQEYKEIERINNNRFLENMKSIRYCNSSDYHKLMDFIESDKYQIYIWGHSCGNSDGTLLKQLFEHKNCCSIKPFYHKRNNGSDNYNDVVMNIYRHFSNKEICRNKILSKEYCKELK